MGADDLRNSLRPAVAIEVRSDPLWAASRVSVGVAAAAEKDDDFWAGAGPLLLVPLGQRWRLEGSVMLGWYRDGGGNDLGTDFPIFRSQIGASYLVGDGWRVGVAVNHKSNARTAERNPGVETFFVTLARQF